MGQPRRSRHRGFIAEEREGDDLMLVVIPFVAGMLAVETEALGTRLGAGFVDVGDDGEAYYRLLSRLWAEGEAFAIVEHDILPEEQVLDSMLTCSQPWCAAAFPQLLRLTRANGEPVPRLQLALTWALGCMRFEAALLRSHPDAMERAGTISRHWSALDKALLHVVLKDERQVAGPHLHYGEVRHLRCESDCFPLLPRLAPGQ